jgi:hypothetical protein
VTMICPMTSLLYIETNKHHYMLYIGTYSLVMV